MIYIPFESIWLWFHCIWVTWKFLLVTSDLLQVVAAPFSKSRCTNSWLTAKSPIPPSLSRFLGTLWIKAEIFPRRFPYLRKYFLCTLLFPLCTEIHPPIVATISDKGKNNSGEMTNLPCHWSQEERKIHKKNETYVQC